MASTRTRKVAIFTLIIGSSFTSSTQSPARVYEKNKPIMGSLNKNNNETCPEHIFDAQIIGVPFPLMEPFLLVAAKELAAQSFYAILSIPYAFIAGIKWILEYIAKSFFTSRVECTKEIPTDAVETNEKRQLLVLSNNNAKKLISLNDNKNKYRFLASYGGYTLSDNKTQHPNNNEPNGSIIVYEWDELDDKCTLHKKLESQSIITCAKFHPTKENIIIGASVPGQVLHWEIRLNKITPARRTEFSACDSCLSQVILPLHFYNNIRLNDKIQQILTLSNAAKLFIGRDVTIDVT